MAFGRRQVEWGVSGGVGRVCEFAVGRKDGAGGGSAARVRGLVEREVAIGVHPPDRRRPTGLEKHGHALNLPCQRGQMQCGLALLTGGVVRAASPQQHLEDTVHPTGRRQQHRAPAIVIHLNRQPRSYATPSPSF